MLNLGLVLFFIDGLWSIPFVLTSVVFLLLIHELGHAFVVRQRGLAVQYIEIRFMSGRCEYEYYQTADNERDKIYIAWGGVLVQLIVLAPASIMLVMNARMDPGLPPAAVSVLRLLSYYNAFIILLNLIPIEPLDGHLAWRIFERSGTRRHAKRSKHITEDGTIQFRKRAWFAPKFRRNKHPNAVIDLADYRQQSTAEPDENNSNEDDPSE